MSSSSLVFTSATLLVLILTVESVYYAYLYDDHNGDKEHCCLVRIRDNFCWAKPITRSLVQATKQCNQFRGSKHHRRFGKNKKYEKYLDKISRRLNVQQSSEIGDKILIELKKPLERKMLDKDLLCLTSVNNDINLEKCYVETTDETVNHGDDSDEHVDDDGDSESCRRHSKNIFKKSAKIKD